MLLVFFPFSWLSLIWRFAKVKFFKIISAKSRISELMPLSNCPYTANFLESVPLDSCCAKSIIVELVFVLSVMIKTVLLVHPISIASTFMCIPKVSMETSGQAVQKLPLPI
jgi:hypothetical protein